MSVTLSDYGNSFQSKAVAILLRNKYFLEQILDILVPEYFDNDGDIWIVNTIKEYYRLYSNIPSADYFMLKINQIKESDSVLKTSIKMRLKDAISTVNAEDSNMVESEFLNFCKTQSFRLAFTECIPLLEKQDHDSIVKKLMSANTAGIRKQLGHNYIKDIALRKEGLHRTTIKTGVPVFDEILDGGLSHGELGVVAAPPGVGKSWALVNFAMNAVKSGLKVIHFSLELNDIYTAGRYDSKITNIVSNKVKYHFDAVEEKIKELPESAFLEIVYYPTKTATVDTLRACLQQYKLKGIEPDLIIVDYADLLKPIISNGSSYHDVGAIYEDLRGLAGEFKIPCWTASQINRSASDDDVITGDKLAESYKKLMTADFLVTISRRDVDKMNNTARWHIVKNRFGVDGITYPSRYDTSIGSLDIYPPNSKDGFVAKRDMSHTNSVVKKQLKQSTTTEFGDFG